MRKIGRKPKGRDVMEAEGGVPREKSGSAVSPAVEGSRQPKTKTKPLSFEGSESGKWCWQRPDAAL